MNLLESRQMRLARLYPGATVKHATELILVPKPDGDALAWATTLVEQVFE